MKKGKFAKQAYEEYVIAANFAKNMDITGGEDLVKADCTVEAVDVDGADAASVVTDQTTIDIGTGAEQGYLKILIKGGTVDKSPYHLTFKGKTNTTPAEKWEKDVYMTIKEL